MWRTEGAIFVSCLLLLSCGVPDSLNDTPRPDRNVQRSRPDHSIILIPVEENEINLARAEVFLNPTYTIDYLIPKDIYIGALQDAHTRNPLDRAVYTIARDFAAALISREAPLPPLNASNRSQIEEEVNFLYAAEFPPHTVRIGIIRYSQDNQTAGIVLHLQSRKGHTAAYLYLSQLSSENSSTGWEIIRLVIQRDAINTLLPEGSLPFDLFDLTAPRN